MIDPRSAAVSHRKSVAAVGPFARQHLLCAIQCGPEDASPRAAAEVRLQAVNTSRRVQMAGNDRLAGPIIEPRELPSGARHGVPAPRAGAVVPVVPHTWRVAARYSRALPINSKRGISSH